MSVGVVLRWWVRWLVGVVRMMTVVMEEEYVLVTKEYVWQRR